MPALISRRRVMLAGLLGSALLASGCGFRLRGAQHLPYATLYISGVGQHSELREQLRQQIEASGSTRVVDNRDEAEVRLEILNRSRDREILSLSGGGRVTEYELTQRITYRLVEAADEVIIPSTTVRARRSYDFDDEQVIAKGREEALLYEDMENDLIQQIMRRLATLDAS